MGNDSGPGRLAAVLTDGAAAADLYSVEGAQLYERFTEFDDSEQRELLHRLARAEGDILELACGGGRLALPMLSLGRPVVGLDLSGEMIRMLRGRYERLPGSRRRTLLTAVVADMRDFDLGRRFGAIVLATTSVFLLDAPDRQKLFSSVRRHLASDGIFIVSVYARPLRPGATTTRIIPLSGEPDSVALLSDLVGADGRTREISALRITRRPDGTLDVASFSSAVHTATEEELDRELASAGFTRVETIDVPSATDEGALRLLGYTA